MKIAINDLSCLASAFFFLSSRVTCTVWKKIFTAFLCNTSTDFTISQKYVSLLHLMLHVTFRCAQLRYTIIHGLMGLAKIACGCVY